MGFIMHSRSVKDEGNQVSGVPEYTYTDCVLGDANAIYLFAFCCRTERLIFSSFAGGKFTPDVKVLN